MHLVQGRSGLVILLPFVERAELFPEASNLGVRAVPHKPLLVRWARKGALNVEERCPLGRHEEHEGCAVLMTNGDDGNKSMEIGNRYAGKIFIDLLQKHAAEVTINEEGWGEFFVNAGSVSVWVPKQ